MQLVFADDSKQTKCTRSGIRAVSAVGGLRIDADNAKNAEEQLELVCRKHGFPVGEEFKWSPPRNYWMAKKLYLDLRTRFFKDVLTVLRDNKVKAMYVCVDQDAAPATEPGRKPDEDALVLFIERVHHRMQGVDQDCLMIVDRPSGGRSDEDSYLLGCLETLRAGTNYVLPKRIALNVVATPSKFVRLLQAADLIASCTTAYVAGESCFSPRVISDIRVLLGCGRNRVGGRTVKLHPENYYLNLYHWLFHDKLHITAYKDGRDLPHPDYPYAMTPDLY